MPLRKGYSKRVITANIAEMIKSERPHNSAVAIAHKSAREAFRAKHPRAAWPTWIYPPSPNAEFARRMSAQRNPRAKSALALSRVNPVPPSSRSDSARRLAQGADLYERFTGHKARYVDTVKIPSFPKELVQIGQIDGILYSTVRDGVPEKYIHKFKQSARPLFTVSPDGRQIVLIGGSYDFTERGIVDKTT